MRNLTLLTLLLVFAAACDMSKIPGLWKTYTHPTYRTSVRVPRSWEAQKDSVMGAAYVFLAPEDGSSFRTNATLVVQKLQKPLTLEQLTQLSIQQITLLFNQYQLLGQVNTQLGELAATEIRGRYNATEGSRIVRTIMAIEDGSQYVLTFTVNENHENQFVETFDSIRKSFELSNLSRR